MLRIVQRVAYDALLKLKHDEAQVPGQSPNRNRKIQMDD